VLTKQDVKTKIRSLKKDRDAALEQKDARALSILRRRINRLKKLSRKIA